MQNPKTMSFPIFEIALVYYPSFISKLTFPIKFSFLSSTRILTAIREIVYTNTLHLPLSSIPSILSSILTWKLTLAMIFVIRSISFISAEIFHHQNTIARFLILHYITFIDISVFFMGVALSWKNISLKSPFVVITIWITKVAFSIVFSFYKVTLICCSICCFKLPKSLYIIVLPFSTIQSPIWSFQFTKTRSFTILEVSHI